MPRSSIDTLDRQQLLELARMFAKDWLAHDGLWFQAVERAFGLERAVALDAEAWRAFADIEARRIKEFLGLPDGGGLDALERALEFRLYAVLNRQTAKRQGDRLLFHMNECRVQSARSRKGLPGFPCKEVGLVEFDSFARAVDPRIETRCIACPPDDHPADFFCAWEFRLAE